MSFHLDTQNRESWPNTSELVNLRGTVEGFDYGFEGEMQEQDYYHMARMPGFDIERSNEKNYHGNYDVSGVTEERYLEALERRLVF